jgi:hypothetical protein
MSRKPRVAGLFRWLGSLVVAGGNFPRQRLLASGERIRSPACSPRRGGPHERALRGEPDCKCVPGPLRHEVAPLVSRVPWRPEDGRGGPITARVLASPRYRRAGNGLAVLAPMARVCAACSSRSGSSVPRRGGRAIGAARARSSTSSRRPVLAMSARPPSQAGYVKVVPAAVPRARLRQSLSLPHPRAQR